MRQTTLHSTPRRRLLLGVVLLVVGGCLLASNLGFEIHRYLWLYWPFLLMGVGGLQLAWPGAWHERRSGFWLFVLGLWGAINIYEWAGLHWGNSWPIFIIGLGIRVILDGVFRVPEKAAASLPGASSQEISHPIANRSGADFRTDSQTDSQADSKAGPSA